MFDHLRENLKRWLPFAPAYSLFLATLPLVAYLYTSPEGAINTLGLTLTQDKITATKCLFAPFLLLLAMATSHVLVVSRLFSIERKVTRVSIKLKAGEYSRVSLHDGCEIKIALVKVSRESLPTDYTVTGKEELAITESATVAFYPVMLHHGRRVKKVIKTEMSAEESFIMPVNKNIEEEESVYFYNVNHNNGAVFFCCSVEHINSEAREVELNVFSFIASK